MNEDNENMITRAAKNVKEVGDTFFDNMQQGLETAESATMNAVDKTANAINELVEDNLEKK